MRHGEAWMQQEPAWVWMWMYFRGVDAQERWLPWGLQYSALLRVVIHSIRTWPFLEERNYIKLKIWSTPPEYLGEASYCGWSLPLISPYAAVLLGTLWSRQTERTARVWVNFGLVTLCTMQPIHALAWHTRSPGTAFDTTTRSIYPIAS